MWRFIPQVSSPFINLIPLIALRGPWLILHPLRNRSRLSWDDFALQVLTLPDRTNVLHSTDLFTSIPQFSRRNDLLCADSVIQTHGASFLH